MPMGLLRPITYLSTQLKDFYKKPRARQGVKSESEGA